MKMICEMAPNSSLRILNYRLYHEDKLITKQSNSGMFRISRVGLKDSGSYTCVPETHLALGRNKTLRLHVRGERRIYFVSFIRIQKNYNSCV